MEKNTKSALLVACRRLLRPVARLLIKSGVSWKDFADVSKQSFVDVATEEFGIRGRPTNQARVSILTGINRREVARLRELASQPRDEEPTYMNAAQRLLSGWHQDPEYGMPDAPKVLPLDGPAPSFATLCAAYAGDMPATALLKELRNVKAVAMDDKTHVRALTRVYIPKQIDADSALRAGGVLEDLGTVLAHNLTCDADSSRRFERRAENDAIDAKHVAAFKAFLEQEGQAFLERVDQWLTDHQQPDAASDAKPVRLGAGLYSIQDLNLRTRK